MSELQIKLSQTQHGGPSASTSSTRPPSGDAARIRKTVGSRTASWRGPSFGSRCSRTAGMPVQERAEGGRHLRGAARAPGRGQIGGHRLEAGETDVVGGGVLTEAGGRVAKVVEETEETDVVRSGILTAIDDQVVKMSGRLVHQEASETHDQNGWTSEGYRAPELSERRTVERPPARVAGTPLEGRRVPRER